MFEQIFFYWKKRINWQVNFQQLLAVDITTFPRYWNFLVTLLIRLTASSSREVTSKFERFNEKSKTHVWMILILVHFPNFIFLESSEKCALADLKKLCKFCEEKRDKFCENVSVQISISLQQAWIEKHFVDRIMLIVATSPHITNVSGIGRPNDQ